MDVRHAVTDADLRVLLMSVFHLTGDHRWLEPPFTPTRDVNLIADEQAGLAPEAADEIREAAIAHAGSTPVVDDPGDELMLEMLRVCLGEVVPPEYAPMLREEVGFCPRDVEWTGPGAPTVDLDVLVVGAGASGIAMGARLGRLGIPYSIVERADAVGGVWRDNRYPGCGVDTPNHAYSFSFLPPNHWSRFFAPRDELAAYLRRAADETGVVDHVALRAEVRSATWSESDRRWQVELSGPDGTETRSCRVLVSAIGQLDEPSVPEIPGLPSFAGPCFHSARWPEGLDLTGKRVAVIGTGASAMQIVPAIVDEVAALTVFQRSPQWVRPIPRYHEPIPDGSRWLLEHLPHYAAWFRATMWWRFGDGLLPMLRKDPDWAEPDRSLNRANDRHRRQMEAHLVAELAERPELVERCLPDYPPYGKRILLDAGWYRALTRPHVELVGSAVARLDPDAVVAADGSRHEADVVVLATGFEVTRLAARLGITGRGGVDLAEVWADGDPRAHLGITVPGFPNLFCLQGPNTGLGHGGSAIFQSECQARYITSCLAAMAARGLDAIEVRRDVHDDYVARVDAEHEQLVWTHPGMSTYYRNTRGRVVSVMPWRLVDYWAMTHDVDLDDFEIVAR